MGEMWNNKNFCFLKKGQVTKEKIRYVFLDLTARDVDVFDMRESEKKEISFGRSVAGVREWNIFDGSLYGRLIRNADSDMYRGDIIHDICADKILFMPIRTEMGDFVGIALVDKLLDDYTIWGENS